MRVTGSSLWLPAAGAAAAAPLAGAALGASATAALCAGAFVALAGSGLALALSRDDAPLGGRLAAGSGMLLLGAASALPALPGAPAWLQPLLLVAGALGVAGGLGRLEAARRRAQETAASLQATLIRREGDVRAQAERIRKLDQWDITTGLLNRRGFLSCAADALHECAATAEPLVLLLVELPDPLPGPQSAELKRVSRAVRRAVRGSDLAGRLDDSRLAVLLPRCRDPRPALRRLGGGLSPDACLAGVSVAARGPWPDAEGLIASAEAALSASRRLPPVSEPAIWPIDWGLAVPANATGPVVR